MSTDSNEPFDEYATDYDRTLSEGLSVSGESKDFFARRRIEWLRDQLLRVTLRFDHVMDYGCGTGSSAPLLAGILRATVVVGADRSRKSLDVAMRTHGSNTVKFIRLDEYQPDSEFDLVYCNGVFHHIPVSERGEAIGFIYQSVRPGGFFAFWENNPWNPGTRLVMSRIPFDRDAVTITAPQARELLQSRGFEILRTDFLFIFPNGLRWLRWIEPFCASLPLGAQYLVLCRRPMPAR